MVIKQKEPKDIFDIVYGESKKEAKMPRLDKETLRVKLRRIKDRCLECKGRDIAKVLACEDRECKYKKDHDFLLRTTFPHGCRD